jgi:quercetin dioxygenase-like cupin family protein
VIVVKSEDLTSPAALAGGTGELWQSLQFDADGVRTSTIFFAPGARTFWHTHERGQILQVLAGSGFVCTRSGASRLIGAGDVIWTPPDEEHWHGAAPQSFLVHTAVSLGAAERCDDVTDDDYAVASARARE